MVVDQVAFEQTAADADGLEMVDSVAIAERYITPEPIGQQNKGPEQISKTSEETNFDHVAKTASKKELFEIRRKTESDQGGIAGRLSPPVAPSRSNINIPNIKLTLGNNPKSPLLTCVMQSGAKLYLYKADITKLQVGAIVNAANEDLLHGAGVAGAIARAAGPSFQRESDQFIREYGKVPLSEVLVQAAGPRLPCMHVINAVGPEWYKFSKKEKCKNALVCAFFNCFRCANDTCGVTSLALPPISAGIVSVGFLLFAS